YSFGSRDNLFTEMNWALSTDRFGDGNLVRGFPDPSRTTTPNLQLNYIHSFGPTLINEFRAGYSGSLTRTGVTLPVVPALYLDDGTLGFGSAAGLPESLNESIYTLSDSVALSRGNHGMKAGLDLRRNIENTDSNVGRPSYFFFDPLFFAIDAPYGEGAG